MQKTILAMMLAAGLLVSGAAANAANINETQAITFDTSTNSSGFSATLGSGLKNKSFDEEFTFSLGTAFDVASAVISITLGNSSLQLTDFTLSGNGQTYQGNGGMFGGTQAWNLSASGLTAGTYTLKVLGNITGSAGGSFGGNINISPVPEASTTAMMLGGLALVGFAATRRRRNKDATPSMGMFAA